MRLESLQVSWFSEQRISKVGRETGLSKPQNHSELSAGFYKVQLVVQMFPLLNSGEIRIYWNTKRPHHPIFIKNIFYSVEKWLETKFEMRPYMLHTYVDHLPLVKYSCLFYLLTGLFCFLFYVVESHHFGNMWNLLLFASKSNSFCCNPVTFCFVI